MGRISSWLMSVLYSLIDIRHFLATTLVGTIGVFVPLTDAHAETTPPSPAGTQTLSAATTIAGPHATVAGTSAIGAAATAQPSGDTSIRPFKFHASDEALADLRRRITATRWPSRELVTDASQGVQLATMRELARNWQSDYDWRKFEARLSALPQFMTTIDGVDIHFIHVRSKHPNALPVIVTHGWPGSIIEQLKIIEPLTNPTANGGNASDAFDVVIPSLPGHGFSGKPTTLGWDPIRIARAWIVLMNRLGYTRYVAQGGDWGSVNRAICSVTAMLKSINLDRRGFLGTAAMTIAAAEFGMIGSAEAQTVGNKQASLPPIKPGTNTSFGSLKQINAGLLSVGYAEAGPLDGPAVLLLQGWPYDIYSYVDVAPLLASAGYRAIVPYLRGYGPTRFLSEKTFRNGQPSVVALDIIALMDALHIKSAIIGGFDWGGRTADIIAVLWPERCKALVSVSGYLMTSQEAQRNPLPPKAELQWWYQYYFATERGRAGYEKYRHDFAKLIWTIASPKWNFDDATFDRSAASFDNPDHVAIVIHNYRWRLGLADGESKYDDFEKRIAEGPVITVPTISLEGDANGAPHYPDDSAYRKKFTGKYEYRVIKGGVGHNLPQEAPQAFAQAIVNVDHM